MTEPPSSPATHEPSRADTAAEGGGENQLANLRHSLRTPLNQILGYSEMLQEDAAELGCVTELLDLHKVHTAGQQLLALINESLTPARVRSGRLDLGEFRRDTRTLLNLIVGYSGICRENLIDPRHRQACDDLGKIETAAANLLGYLGDLSVLETLARQTPAPLAEVRRAAESSGTGRPGTILENQGLVGTVLVVDDDEMNRDLLLRRLERQGHTVLVAENGRQALERLETTKVDLVLLDILMPEMDGLQTLERLKGSEHQRHTPVIMRSALDEIDRVVRCIEVGADDYLSKPYNPVLLRARINACLEKKRLRDQEQAYLEQLQSEREKSEHLLLNILPQSIAARLKNGETIIADSFSDVTVLFADLVDFTRLASRIPASELVRLLNEVFSQFDWLAELHGLEKIKTIGDAYMAVGGLPHPRPDHAVAVAEMALDMQRVIRRVDTLGDIRLELRIGLSSGPVVAGIIGSKKFIYDLWGDTVNTASRMESQGELGCIQVSQSTCDLLRPTYVLRERGRIEVKGKGQMNTYFLVGRQG
ncbi:MAG: response regulator [Verrucomicrobia bacterium]|nr:response regulator [Verrucomicrobiota bacterium]